MKTKKQEYLAPEAEVIEMLKEDVICTSVLTNMDGPWDSEENI